MLADTHAHLDDSAFECDLDEVLARARGAGVDRVLTVGSDLSSSRRAVSLAWRYEMVYAAVGVHPHEATRFSDEADSVRDLLRDERVVAVGEVGLDYYRDVVPRELQLAALREQVVWARESGLPMSVHNRSADAQVLDMLTDAGATVVLHCFSGSWGFARAALEAGFYLSFAGNLTYPKANELREVSKRVPEDRLMIETDAPVLSPQSWRGRRNEPAYLRSTLEALAEVRDIAPAALAERLGRTADALFSWREA